MTNARQEPKEAAPPVGLSSWKEIAAHLGCDVRTAQRYEKERGLPVHRLPGSKRSAVVAYSDELDAWRSPAVAATSLEPPAPTRHVARVPWAIVAAVVILVGIIAVALLWNRSGSPAKATFAGNKLLVWDERGRLAWRYEFPYPIGEFPSDYPNGYKIADLAGNGHLSVIANIRPPEQGVSGRELFCFSEKGKLLWRYRPTTVLRFADTPFEGPWEFRDLLVTSEGKGKTIWLAVAHNPSWPAFLVSLNAQGQARLHFVNTGHLDSLVEVYNKSGRFILASGVSNDFREAMLAVIDPEAPRSTAPAGPRPVYRCDDCPVERPYRYFRFPRSELNELESIPPYNRAAVTFASETRINVSVEEVAGGRAIIYEFTKDLEIAGFYPSSGYKKLHERLTSEGRLNHTLEQCPELTRPRKLSVWSRDSKTWSDVWAQPLAK